MEVRLKLGLSRSVSGGELMRTSGSWVLFEVMYRDQVAQAVVGRMC